MNPQVPVLAGQAGTPTTSFGAYIHPPSTTVATTPPTAASPPPITGTVMPPSIYDDPRLKAAADAYGSAAQGANSSQAAEYSLPQMLKDALTKKFADNPMVQARQNALENYLNVSGSQSSVLPENNGGVIFNPNQQADLLNKRKNAAVAPLATDNYLLGLQSGSITDVINAAANAAHAITQSQQGKADIARNQYSDILNELSKKADEAYRQQQLQLTMSGGVGGLASQGLIKDAQAGMTLKDILNKYAGRLDPTTIYSLYNNSSKYGPAKEGPDQLMALGIKPPLTTDQMTRMTALKPASEFLNSIDPSALNDVGPQNRLAQLSIQHLGGIGVDQNLIKLNQTFELLKQNVVRALQGARMSDQDIKVAQSYIPSITDTKETIQTKLDGLRKYIDSVLGNSSTSSNKSAPGGSDPLGIL